MILDTWHSVYTNQRKKNDYEDYLQSQIKESLLSY